ncbi:hypothetical protein DERP_003635 [Dermatophagoides pteronyssinus]|uniref:Uncharacterized protein n=1 Tax=Dermatophagoides pteronyssinus TaxID=6956 RepID=A0ABQ8JM16_DERPT|nr:hypothetical protein DERP_003635 [Dermatophagoides pteronyssinus]
MDVHPMLLLDLDPISHVFDLNVKFESFAIAVAADDDNTVSDSCSTIVSIVFDCINRLLPFIIDCDERYT